MYMYIYFEKGASALNNDFFDFSVFKEGKKWMNGTYLCCLDFLFIFALWPGAFKNFDELSNSVWNMKFWLFFTKWRGMINVLIREDTVTYRRAEMNLLAWIIWMKILLLISILINWKATWLSCRYSFGNSYRWLCRKVLIL